MSPRLIPWCLAASGFLAVLTVTTWHDAPGGHGSLMTPASVARPGSYPPVVTRLVAQNGPTPPQPQTQLQTDEDVRPVLSLPLPPESRPEQVPAVQPVPDDEPTVDDLPARQPGGAQGE